MSDIRADPFVADPFQFAANDINGWRPVDERFLYGWRSDILTGSNMVTEHQISQYRKQQFRTDEEIYGRDRAFKNMDARRVQYKTKPLPTVQEEKDLARRVAAKDPMDDF